MVGEGHLVEIVVVVAAAHGDLDHGADGRNVQTRVEEARELERPLAAAAEVDEGRVGADGEHRAVHPRAGLERRLEPAGGRGREQGVDLDAGERRVELGGQLVVERLADVGHGDAAGGGRGQVGPRAPRGIAAPALASVAAARGRGGAGRLARGRRSRCGRLRIDRSWNHRVVAGVWLRWGHVLGPRRQRRRLHAGPLRADRDPARSAGIGRGRRVVTGGSVGRGAHLPRRAGARSAGNRT
ncbi:MAG: hypothetical protein ACKON7_04400 [Planctomycetaceae bacterium]